MKLRVLVSGVVAAGLVLAGVGPAVAGSARWEHAGQGWSGTGSAFLPGGKYVGPSPDGTSDSDEWFVWFACEGEQNRACREAWGCSEDQRLGLVTEGPPGFDVPVTETCIGGGEPISTEELARHVRSRVSQLAPKADPGFQPAKNALTQVPTIFWSGQQKDLDRSDTIAGIPVDFQASARWSWNWGDGTKAAETTKPGRDWPDKDVTHTYRRPGKVRVTLTTTWEASFSVNGVGSFPVTGDPVTQTSVFTVDVKEARAVLIGA